MSYNTANNVQSLTAHLAYTIVAATIAAVAATICAALELPVWTMFIGWVAYLSRGQNAKAGLTNLVCVWLGITIGMAATLALKMLGPTFHGLTLPLVVFMVSMLVISLRSVPQVNNLLCYFLGLITLFAAHQTPSLGTFLTLAGASTIGSCAAWVSIKLQRQLPISFF